jgi:hypothetical protein
MWSDNIVLMIRSIIGDLDEVSYTHNRLEQVAIVAAYAINSRFTFSNSYIIDITNLSITPDPFVLGDTDFNILVSYKAACILLSSELKTQAGNSISIKDGPSAIDLSGIGRNLNIAMKNICDQLEAMIYEFQVNSEAGGGGGGHAILSPYSPGSDFTNNYLGDQRWQ